MSDWIMTSHQKRWLEKVIENHYIAASKERLCAFGATDAETAERHFTVAAEHMGFADELRKLLE